MSHNALGSARTINAPRPVTAFDGAFRRLYEYVWNLAALEAEVPIEPGTTLEDVRRRLLVEECLTCPTLTRREAEIVERVATELGSRDGRRGALRAVADELGIQPETARGYWHDAVKKMRAWIQAHRAA